MKKLILNSDDFGMCHSINQGVVKAFTEGLLTQASVMVPTPWFEEAVVLAKRHDIPVGVHLTATCEWNRYRWRPLTGARSLVREDGTSHATIEEARIKVDPAELELEFAAQVETMIACGLPPQHADVHMGMVNEDVFTKICRRFNLTAVPPPSLLTRPEEICYPFDSHLWLQGKTPMDWAFGKEDLETKRRLLKNYLAEMPEGTHYNACHVSVDGDEIASIHEATPPFAWAREIRVTDLEVLCDPEILALTRELNILMVAMRDLEAGR
jgi:chitin disaccharide deacetylase